MHQYQQDLVSVNESLPTNKDPLDPFLQPIWVFTDPLRLLSAAHEAVTELSATSAAFLVAETPIHSSHRLPAFIPTPLTPTHKRKHDLLDHYPESDKEQMYQAALQDAYKCESKYKSALLGMQSTVVLQSIFCDCLSNQLAAQEEKKNGKKNAPLVGDGMPRLLTGDVFYNQVSEHQRAAEKEAAAKEVCQIKREGRAAAMAVWKEAEAAWLKRNKECQATYKDEMRLWEEERDCAKLKKCWPRWKKPKQGKLESLIPKPTLSDAEEDDENGANKDEEIDCDNDSDGGSSEV
ncbi:uncharacterized protein EDB91DRAFT_1057264 [Suillus paluster]|uniref:uncharacterized protein n=1 Tax=Suillus paluster TaxID=48578 RepID=UPI001B87159B|nr:uncharacterized protein EDB91DRAFT_1057264 [Suillus paluster]KAG1733928.1 hypothetical protein EDB91DRAFT_1057264 [Suillus paluster]